jgi:hypothetical protein
VHNITSVPWIATNVIYRHIQEVQKLLYVRATAAEAYYGHLRTAPHAACKSETHSGARSKVCAVQTWIIDTISSILFADVLLYEKRSLKSFTFWIMLYTQIWNAIQWKSKNLLGTYWRDKLYIRKSMHHNKVLKHFWHYNRLRETFKNNFSKNISAINDRRRSLTSVQNEKRKWKT